MTQKIMNGIKRWLVVILATGLVLTIVVIVMIPRNISKVASHSHPVKSYSEALQRVAILRKRDIQQLNPLGRLELMSYGKKVDRALILVHGYTSCPQQFHELGKRFYDLGYNILIAPLPHHGFLDRMTESHGQLTAEELAAYADETVDIAQGLGEQVTMMGISAGGTTTAWAAQNRRDLDMALIISPFFGFRKIPTLFTGALMNVYGFLPDKFIWWNPVLKDKEPPDYAYPQYSQHALVQILRLGFSVQAQARRSKPAAGKIAVVFNANDSMINKDLATGVVKSWWSHNTNLTTYEFKRELSLHHDIIDSSQSAAKVDIVYTRLLKLANR
jgi:carboxylesterase